MHRIWLSGASAAVCSDSTPPSIISTLSNMSVSSACDGDDTSHLQDTSTDGMPSSDNASVGGRGQQTNSAKLNESVKQNKSSVIAPLPKAAKNASIA